MDWLYDLINRDFFEGQLNRPVITIQNTPKYYGHYSVADVWSVDGDNVHEINIGAGILDMPIEIIISTLIHEMCHQYNNEIIGVQDTSRNNVYHNEHFKKTAESHGLIVEKSSRGRGYSQTYASERLLEWIISNDLNEIFLYRKTIKNNNQKKKGNSIRYVCPICEMKIRATKKVKVICGDCMVQMLDN